MFTKTTRGRSRAVERSHTRLVCTTTPITALATTSAPSTTRRAATVSPVQPESPGVSIRLIFRSCHSRWQSDDESDICRRCSSSSQSEVVVPPSTVPRRLIAPAWKSIASTSDVFPVPRWPVTATLRILPGSVGIAGWSSCVSGFAGDPSAVRTYARARDVVAGRGRLPGLPPLVPGLRRGRRRRPARGRRAARAPRLPGRRRALALADLPLPARRLRLRRLRLHGRRPELRDALGLRRARRVRAPPRPASAARLRRVPYVDRAPVVPQAPGPVHLVAGRRAAEQLGRGLRRPGVEPGRAQRPLVPALVLPRAAGSRLAQPGGGRRDAGR